MKNTTTRPARVQDACRFKLTPVAAACIFILVNANSAAFAQQAQDIQQATDNQGNAPAIPGVAQGDADTTPSMATVRVSGIRSGIEAAISIKKNNSSIVEAVSAEDIGKLPDTTVAESISRLSGVTSQRDKTSGKATEISVRGLSPSFNGALLNGREQASTSDARNPEFDLFPAELTGSILVYKTPDASLMGQGLASTIDLHTLRPLEFGKRMLVANARKERIGFDSGGALGMGHRGTLTYIDQFMHRTFGVAIGITSYKQNNGEEQYFDNWGGSTADVPYNGATVKAPGGFLSETRHRRNDRDSAAVTLQFKPNDQFKSTVDLYYSMGHDSQTKTGIEGAVAGSTGLYDPVGVLSNATIANGVATSGTFSNYKGDVRNHAITGNDKLQSLGWNSELRQGDWRFESDLALSRGTRRSSNLETTSGQPGNTPESQLGSISYTGFNGSNFNDVKYTPSLSYADRAVVKLTDVDGWGGGPNLPQAGYASIENIRDTVQSARINAHRDLEWGPVIGARVGANFTKRDKSRVGAGEGRLSVNGGDGYASAEAPGTATALAGPLGIPVVQFDPTGLVGPVYTINRWVDATTLARDWSVGERITTGYAMANLDGKLGGIPYTGNIGVQIVHTQQMGEGNQVDASKCTGNTVETCHFSVATGGDAYNNVLPSMNLTFDLGHDRLFRVGAGKQISRAPLSNLKAGINITLPAATAVVPALSGTGGNPSLRPYADRALDLSFEQYFGKKGYISGALFFKKLDNYIINAPQQYDFKDQVSTSTPLPTTGPFANSTIGFLNVPRNGSGGNMHGAEISANLPFSLFVPALDGFGAAVNYSYTDSSVQLPTSGLVTSNNAPVFVNDVATISLPGLSKNVGSLRLYYEKSGFQISYALRYRSAFIGQILDYRSDSQYTFIHSESIADVQASYEFQGGPLKGVSVFVTGNNLTNTPFKEFTTDANKPTTVLKYGKSYAAGVTYKF